MEENKKRGLSVPMPFLSLFRVMMLVKGKQAEKKGQAING